MQNFKDFNIDRNNDDAVASIFTLTTCCHDGCQLIIRHKTFLFDVNIKIWNDKLRTINMFHSCRIVDHPKFNRILLRRHRAFRLLGLDFLYIFLNILRFHLIPGFVSRFVSINCDIHTMSFIHHVTYDAKFYDCEQNFTISKRIL